MSQQATYIAFAEDFVADDDATLAARAVAAQWGIDCVSAASGAMLTVLMASLGAKHVVEVGTGVGVSGLYLLAGMATDAVLTSIDVEPEHHKAARGNFAAAGYTPERTRLITGRALDVLPRLTDGGYDAVFVDANKAELPDYLEQAIRLVRSGGAIVVAHAFGKGRVPDPAQRDIETTAIRHTLRTLKTQEGLNTVIVPVGDGLAIASVRAQSDFT